MGSKKHCWSCHKEVNNVNNESNYICPNPKCLANYADKPIREAHFQLAQQKYLQNRNDKKALEEMMLIIQEIGYNQIVSKLKGTGKFLDEDDLHDRVGWVLVKMLELYSKEDFKISTSLISYMSQVVLFPLYNNKLQEKEQNEISLFTPVSTGSSNSKKENTLYDLMSETPILDSVCSVENYFYRDMEKENIIVTTNDFFMTMVKGLFKNKGFPYALKMLTVLDYYFQEKSNKVMTSWWDTEGLEFKKTFDNIIKLYRNAIRNLECV